MMKQFEKSVTDIKYLPRYYSLFIEKSYTTFNGVNHTTKGEA